MLEEIFKFNLDGKTVFGDADGNKVNSRYIRSTLVSYPRNTSQEEIIHLIQEKAENIKQDYKDQGLTPPTIDCYVRDTGRKELNKICRDIALDHFKTFKTANLITEVVWYCEKIKSS